MVGWFELNNIVLVTLDRKKLPVRLLTGITVLFLIIAGSPFIEIGVKGADADSNPYVVPSINNLTNSAPTTTGSFISWDTNESTSNRVYLGLNDTEVNSLVNGTYSQWNNDTLDVIIRLSGLNANTTYYYKPESWASGVINNSVHKLELLLPSNQEFGQVPQSIWSVPLDGWALQLTSVLSIYLLLFWIITGDIFQVFHLKLLFITAKTLKSAESH
ncbi:MAG: fibronectin type III domain-containing protein [Candidatus Methanoperedens sp.]|nr:fibronectin type III domain-containing protein [Candidatus Methanoperedens sp.]